LVPQGPQTLNFRF